MRELLGSGILSWDGSERQSDRYGCVSLMNSPYSTSSRQLQTRREGCHGRLIAVVKEARQSHHIGDLFHCVFPTIPNVGEEIVLGEGTLFIERTQSWHVAGLRPDDGRDQLWLDIQALYRAHDQTVDLFFEEDQRH